MLPVKECLLLFAIAASISAYIEDDVKELIEKNLEMFNYLQQQQMYIEERIRSGGYSGLKQIRKFRQGTKPFFIESHTGLKVFAIHNHANHYHTVGMGEVVAVLNGVEFRTRHNDFFLRKPHPTNETFGSTKDVDYPEVPPEVTAKATVEEQVAEMTEWFRAWKDQDYSVRDYRPYFKASLCYLEGAWTVLEDDKVRELASSDRHTLLAKTWPELQAKMRFTAATGTKDQAENYAFLPSTILDMANGTTPVFGQWNYRILCHPISKDVPFNRLKVVDDIVSRVPYDFEFEEYKLRNSARFRMCPIDSDECGSDGFYDFEFIDELMGEIPGMNNYQANITETIHNVPTLDFRTEETLNAGFYHRFFKSNIYSSSGSKNRRRSFADDNIYMAMTTHKEIGSTAMWSSCSIGEDGPSCKVKNEQRWTYAIPIELIYLTPIHKWNPYNIAYYGDATTDTGKGTISNGRNGGLTTATAFNGTNSNNYFRCPNTFFTGGEVNKDSADTAGDSTGVLDPNNIVQKTSASGVRVFLPEIPTVGIIRTRFPIAPLHGEGSAAWKELDALEDLIMNHCSKRDLFPTGSPYFRDTVIFITAMGNGVEAEGFTNHTHGVVLSIPQSEAIRLGHSMTITTGIADAGPPHNHTMLIDYLPEYDRLAYNNCDGQTKCEHDIDLVVLEGMHN